MQIVQPISLTSRLTRTENQELPQCFRLRASMVREYMKIRLDEETARIFYTPKKENPAVKFYHMLGILFQNSNSNGSWETRALMTIWTLLVADFAENNSPQKSEISFIDEEPTQIPLQTRLQRIQRGYASSVRYEIKCFEQLANIRMHDYMGNVAFWKDRNALSHILHVLLHEIGTMTYREVVEKLHELSEKERWDTEYKKKVLKYLMAPAVVEYERYCERANIK